MAKKKPVSARLERRHRLYGWTALLLWLTFGTVLEFLNGFKAADYLLDPIRQQFWQLAHFHGATLALANLVYLRWANAAALTSRQQSLASWCLIAGSILMPVGFFLGGWQHYEGDPGLGIFLAPPGAILILIAVAFQTFAAWRQ